MTARYRTGVDVGHALYRDGEFIGCAITPELASELVIAANKAASPRRLHDAVDVLLAEFIADNPGKMPSKTSVIELLKWNKARW